MAESGKLNLDGGQAKDEERGTYKAVPESDTDFRTSNKNLSKSKEKVSADGAEEKLLKEEEAKLAVVMADAKYVVGDHRNGDAKIELDANKRQFSGLTKEELLKYAEDTFWVRLRWAMFVLFWLLWLCMLAAAIAIIVYAPKCAAPLPRKWYEKGPLVELDGTGAELPAMLAQLQAASVQGVFVDVPDAYRVLDDPSALDTLKNAVVRAKEYGVKVIAELTPTFVSTSHAWFARSANRTAPYDGYFVWAKPSGFDDKEPKKPNNWVATTDEPAWSFNEQREEFYLQQFGAGRADLNFRNPEVVQHFETVLQKVMAAGASGVRLRSARQLFVSTSLADEVEATGAGSTPGAVHTQYAYWRHSQAADQPELDDLLVKWAAVVDAAVQPPAQGESVFTLLESGPHAELYALKRSAALYPALRPPGAAPRALTARVTPALPPQQPWPAMQLLGETDEATAEVALISLLLPAAPVWPPSVLQDTDNDTQHSIAHVVGLRSDASIEHGNYLFAAAPTNSTEQVYICVRWKAGHTGYVGVYNPHGAGVWAAAAAPALPPALALLHASPRAAARAQYKHGQAVNATSIFVPARTAVILSFVPNTTVEQ